LIVLKPEPDQTEAVFEKFGLSFDWVLLCLRVGVRTIGFFPMGKLTAPWCFALMSWF
jgi:hypothetical protein